MFELGLFSSIFILL